MSDTELMDEFIRVDGNHILVCEVDWPRPDKPESNWVVAKKLPKEATEADIHSAKLSVLHDPRYFSICKECGERNPNGWMSSDHICHSCSERNHGVVY